MSEILGPVLSAGGTTVTQVARASSVTARRSRGAVFAVWSRPYELAVTTPAGDEERVRIRDVELGVLAATAAIVILAAAVRVRRWRNA